MKFNEIVDQGRAFLDKKEYASALKKFEAALKLPPGDGEEFSRDDIISLNENLKTMISVQEEEAQHCVNEAKHRAKSLGINLADIDTIINEGTVAYKNNSKDENIKTMLGFAHYIRGLLFDSKRDSKNAFKDYKEAVGYSPDNLLALKCCGQKCEQLKNYDQAIMYFEKYRDFIKNSNNVDEGMVVKAKEFLADAHSSRGIEYHKKGEYAKAIDDFKKSLEYEESGRTRELLEMAKNDMKKK